jgi:hypothetical protein
VFVGSRLQNSSAAVPSGAGCKGTGEQCAAAVQLYVVRLAVDSKDGAGSGHEDGGMGLRSSYHILLADAQQPLHDFVLILH